MKLSFLIIDDSELDCYVAEKLIKSRAGISSVHTFLEAEAALAHIINNKTESNALTVILLDILMPVMDGHDFLDEFEKLPSQIVEKYLIIAITSSLNKNEIETIGRYRSVKAVIDKPIKIGAVARVLKENNARLQITEQL
ncbi:response regulator [Arcticibacter sp. MXS-1]|uniref:response regulator n=1 Tax=Arcticibacter sp. MXS-1 TaxID=3341726 RepID=UPI0035A8EE1C